MNSQFENSVAVRSRAWQAPLYDCAGNPNRSRSTALPYDMNATFGFRGESVVAPHIPWYSHIPQIPFAGCPRHGQSRRLAESTPLEIFDNILSHVISPPTSGADGMVVGARRLLSLCSCVCRYWAQTCRPWLLRRITLRSAHDLRSFIALLDAPPIRNLPPFATLVEAVVNEVDLRPFYSSDPGWLHHIALTLIPKLRRHRLNFGIFVKITGFQDRILDMRLVIANRALPRTLPFHASHYITRVTFSDTKFDDATHVSNAIHLFPNARAVDLHDVRSGRATINHPEEYRSLTLTAATTLRKSASINATTSAMCFIHALLCRRPPNSAQRAGPVDIAVVSESAGYLDLVSVLRSLARDFYMSIAQTYIWWDLLWHVHREVVEDIRCMYNCRFSPRYFSED